MVVLVCIYFLGASTVHVYAYPNKTATRRQTEVGGRASIETHSSSPDGCLFLRDHVASITHWYMTATHTTARIRAPTVPMTAKKIELVEFESPPSLLVGVSVSETQVCTEQLHVLSPVILKTVFTFWGSKREKLRVMFTGDAEVCRHGNVIVKSGARWDGREGGYLVHNGSKTYRCLR